MNGRQAHKMNDELKEGLIDHLTKKPFIDNDDPELNDLIDASNELLNEILDTLEQNETESENENE